MSASPPPQFSISTLINAAKNYWFAAFAVMFLTMALTVLAMIFLPRKYVSEAMIFVKLGRETVSLDPTASTGSMVSVLESRDNEINSIRDMLYSRGIMEKVADRIGPEVILGDAPLTDADFQSDSSPEADYIRSPRQKAIVELIENTSVITARKSSVLKLAVKAASPELAQRILTEYLDVYLAMHTEAHQTPQSNQFFEQQSRLLKTQWEESMKALQIAKENAGVVSIEGAKENLKAQSLDTETILMSVKSSLASTQAKLERFEEIIGQNPLDQQRIRDEYLTARSELAAMTAQKTELESQMREFIERAAKLNRDEVTIGGLEQEVNIAASNFAQYQELFEQTRIEEALHNNRFTNVRLVQEPSFVPKPVSPKKMYIGAAGLVAGTSGAVLFAVMLELLWPGKTRKDEDDRPVDETDYPENDEFTEREVPAEISREIVDASHG